MPGPLGSEVRRSASSAVRRRRGALFYDAGGIDAGGRPAVVVHPPRL